MVFMHYIEPESTTLALELYMSPKEFIDPHHRPDYTGIPNLSVLKQMSIYGIGLIIIAILACLLIPLRAAVRNVMSPKKLSDFLNNGDISVSSSESEVSEDEKNRRSKKIKLTVQERRAKEKVRELRREARHVEKRNQKLKEQTKKFYVWKEETEKKMAGKGVPW